MTNFKTQKVGVNLLTTQQLADRTGIPPKTLNNWRYAGVGPKWTRLRDTPKGRIRYKLADVIEWENGLTTYSNVNVDAEADRVA